MDEELRLDRGIALLQWYKKHGIQDMDTTLSALESILRDENVQEGITSRLESLESAVEYLHDRLSPPEAINAQEPFSQAYTERHSLRREDV